jgi:predicted HicB family RNase H-like nuclease
MPPRKKLAGSSELRIRCDEELHQQLVEAAKGSLRSITREVIFRLRASLNERSGRAHSA